eukprot:Unigene9084_Nuclearia_a/m.27779 Unigene9084_Nuclearia_a/g.27779  ORF Unigene9084_Nuclearia_a/g.27779 Unigene9084_Nuclearia_a/m.27779 type:complete len:1010 (+) Unigene9084_Nuclearia_a:3301-6330(+)
MNAGDLGQVRTFAHKYYQLFTKRWSNLHALVEASRLRMLQTLETVVEIEEFADVRFAQARQQGEAMAGLLRAWQRRYPAVTDDVSFAWDDVVENRATMIEHWQRLVGADRGVAEDFARQMTLASADDIKTALERATLAYRQEMVAAALKQHNWSLADTTLRRASRAKGTADESQTTFLTLRLAQQRATWQIDNGDVPGGSAALLKLITDSQRTRATLTGAADKVRWQLFEADAWKYLMAEVEASEDTWRAVHALPELAALVPGAQNNRDKTLRQIEGLVFAQLDRVTGEASELIGGDVRMRQAASMTLVKFCDRFLRQQEDEGARPSKEREVYPSVVVEQLLGCLQLGVEHDAIQLLPRLLQMLELYPGVKERFVHGAAAVPSWMFLKWVPQLVALLDKAESSAVHGVVARLAGDYPEAVRYPFTISSESFEPTTREQQQQIQRLQAMLDSRTHRQLVESLMLLSNPEHLLDDWVERVTDRLSRLTSEDDKKQLLLQEFAFVQQHFVQGGAGDGSAEQIHKEFAKKAGPKIVQVAGARGELLSEKILPLLKTSQLKLGDIKRSGGCDELKKYSVFLANFQAGTLKDRMELPGQYTGMSRPEPLEHETIHSFGQTVLVLGSIRKPKRLIVYGSDGKEHMYLVKGGEDLRLDQRIEQLFGVMNDVLRQESEATVRTYQVVPMTTSLGMIEWISNTRTLRDITERRDPNKSGPQDILHEVASFINSGTRGYQAFVLSYKERSREDSIAHMNRLYARVPETLLQSYFLELAASPEAFLVLRNRFARSLAVINVCSYLCGVGDRHLENFLLDQTVGELVPIDFGHSFGSATQNLPVPELIPFRLTRQMITFMGPLGTGGIYTSTMVQSLAALQQAKERLLNAMDVFLKDPLMDWKKELRKMEASVGAAKGAGKASSGIAQYAAGKLRLARMKLERANPVAVMEQELAKNHQPAVVQNMEHIKRVLAGTPGVNERARREYRAVCPDAWAQVSCLIDLATDPAILARCWQGLAPWY